MSRRRLCGVHHLPSGHAGALDADQGSIARTVAVNHLCKNPEKTPSFVGSRACDIIFVNLMKIAVADPPESSYTPPPLRCSGSPAAV